MILRLTADQLLLSFSRHSDLSLTYEYYHCIQSEEPIYKLSELGQLSGQHFDSHSHNRLCQKRILQSKTLI